MISTSGTMLPASRARLLPATEWLLIATALVHLWVVPHHLREWWGYGAFFALIALGQGAYSLLLPRLADRPWYLWLGIAATAALVGLWMQTRLGHPLVGPHRIHAEEFGALDNVNALIEATIAAFLLLLLLPLRRLSANSSMTPEPSPCT